MSNPQLVNYLSLNRPYFSCVLNHQAFDYSEAGGDIALIRTSLVFSFKCQLVSSKTT